VEEEFPEYETPGRLYTSDPPPPYRDLLARRRRTPAIPLGIACHVGVDQIGDDGSSIVPDFIRPRMPHFDAE
jgi:hypothetical protein